MIRNEKIQNILEPATSSVKQILGLGIVIKATVVKELIEYAKRKIIKSIYVEEQEPVINKSDQNH